MNWTLFLVVQIIKAIAREIELNIISYITNDKSNSLN